MPIIARIRMPAIIHALRNKPDKNKTKKASSDWAINSFINTPRLPVLDLKSVGGYLVHKGS